MKARHPAPRTGAGVSATLGPTGDTDGADGLGDHCGQAGPDAGPPAGHATAATGNATSGGLRLGVRQRRFVEEYLVDMSPARAAERAGYAPSQAARTAARLLRSPAVAAAVNRATAERAARTGITQDLVVKELAAVGFAVMTDLCHWSDDGVRLLDSASLTREQAAAVAEVREASTGRNGRSAKAEPGDAPVRGCVQVKLHSKLKALEMLARHLGMFGGGPGTGDANEAVAPPELPPELQARLDALYPPPGELQGHDVNTRDSAYAADDSDDADEGEEDGETAHDTEYDA